MKFLDTLSKRISLSFAVLASVTLGIIMFLMTADVLRRTFTGRSIPGTTEFSEVFLVVTAYLGLAFAMRTGAHVGVDIFVDRLKSRRAAHIVFGTGLTIGIIVITLMTVQTAGAAIHSISVNEFRYGLVPVPIWPAKLVVPIALAAWLLESVVQLLKLITGRPINDKAENALGGTPDLPGAGV